MAAYARYPSLHGQTAFITGGATGIGAELVTQFSQQSARVAFVDLQDRAAKELIAKVRTEVGVEPWFKSCDVSDIGQLQAAIAACARALGPVQVLVNNAANDERRPIGEVTPQFWDSMMQVNLQSFFFAVQAVAPDMCGRRSGSIINLGSITWRAGFSNVSVYATSKAAIEGLTRAQARDLGPYGVRVNCLIPGWTMTQRQLADWVTPEAEREIDRAQCLSGRVMPADVARLALWLAADDSRMCTSQTWVVDGGWI